MSNIDLTTFGVHSGYTSSPSNQTLKAEQGYIKDQVYDGFLAAIWVVRDNTAREPELKINGVQGKILNNMMEPIGPPQLTKGMHLFAYIERYDGWWMLN